jgi:hypothetical protein
MLILGLRQWPCRDRFCSEWMPIHWLWVHAKPDPLDYTWSNTQNSWHSVDNLLMMGCSSVDNLSTLCWRTFSGVAVSTHDITYKGCQCFNYGQMPYHSPWIIQVPTPKIVDALLTLMVRLGMWPCRILFCPSRLPICCLWIAVSKWHPN